MLAIVALTGKRRLMVLVWIFAAFGVVIGIAGLTGLPLHPTALMKLLS